MDLTFLQPLYETSTPVGSLYINTSRDAEDTDHAVRVRWDKARDELRERGLDEATLEAMDRVVGVTEGVPGPHGQVVYAAGGKVLLDSTVSEPPQDHFVRVGTLPDPLPALAAEGSHVPHVLAVLDSIGADLIAEYADGRTVTRRIEGEDKPTHKVREGGYHHKQMQRAVDEQVGHNLDGVAEAFAELADRSKAEVVAVAGETSVRGDLVQRLPERVRERAVELESGSRASGSEASPLEEELEEHLDRQADEHVRDAVEAFDRGGPDGASAEGLDSVVHALQRGQVETLLWSEGFPGSERKLWIGPSGEQIALNAQELRDMGVSDPVEEEAGPALVRSVSLTGAGFLRVPGQRLAPEDGIAAVLRFAT
ncbi:baeRF2 domain-containing protein [Nocardiopsis xinjiangensis]|uniref:baeRF2 domain-containing protein n=1 Tax=Nocardiopsis xinjiangensis TaxID=124285 RepID=UPI00034DB8D8|nr:Vms1/Ankzf1 family peptidyl-tRNA hydrolase [Nocardiopsis xinjiangensis]